MSVYFNALLANLNTRKRLRDDLAIDFSDYETGTYQMRRNMDIGKQLTSGVQFSSATENSPDTSLSHCNCKTHSFTRHDSGGDREVRPARLVPLVLVLVLNVAYRAMIHLIRNWSELWTQVPPHQPWASSFVLKILKTLFSYTHGPIYRIIPL